MLSCILELSDVGVHQWLWSRLSAWQTLTTLLSNTLIGPWSYGSILPVQCPCQGEHTNCFFALPESCLLFGLSFFPPNVEREQSPVLVPICASDSRVRVLVV